MGKFEIEDMVDSYLEGKMTEKLPTVPESDLGLGFEDMEGQDFSFPFLIVCQANSPYLNPAHTSYIEDAKQGMIINTMNNNIYKEVNVIPCKYTFRYVEWKPRGQGGGFAGTYERSNVPNDVILDQLTGKTIRPNGNEVMATAYYLCLLVEEDFEKVIIPMYSTQLKKGRKWNSLMVSLKQDGQPQPMFNKIYKLSVVAESNSKGAWYGWKIDFASDITLLEFSKDLYDKAKETSQVKSFLPEQLIKTIAQHSASAEDSF